MELVLTYKNILANKKLKMFWNFESVGGNVGGIWRICKYIGVSKCLRVSSEFISTNTLSVSFKYRVLSELIIKNINDSMTGV